MSVIYL